MAEPIRSQERPTPEPPPRPEPSDREVALQNRWQELRALLLDPERKRLRAVEQRLEDPGLSVEQVSRVLPEAVAKRSASDRDLGVALGPVVGDAIKASIRKDPQPVVDAIFPIIGPAIRRAIASAFQELAQSINAALEHSFTPRGLAWRFEAMRTGRSFGDVVLSHSLVFRVEQLFVIHRDSGLLVEHRTAPGVQALSPDLVAAMLTAITDFVRDSFRVSQHEGLESMALGDLTVWIEQGPAATIASVIRGHAPTSYRRTLQTAIEELHRVHGTDLDRSAASGITFPIRQDILEPCVTSQVQTVRGNSVRRMAVIGALVLAGLGVWLVPRIVRAYRVSRYVAALRQEPGVVVAGSVREGSQYVITGLRDPLARDPALQLSRYHLDSADVRASWEPYVALRPAFIARRVQNAVAVPAGVTVSVRGDTLVMQGVAARAWRDRALQLARAVAGVGTIDSSGLQDSVRVALQQRADSIAARVLPFNTAESTLSASVTPLFDTLATRLRALLADAQANAIGVTIEVLGAADPTGSHEVNVALREARAVTVRQRLIAAGMPPSLLTALPDSTSSTRQTRVVARLIGPR